MPADQRAGLLTHPAWLAAWSLNDGNDPIHRGIWVLEKLLAGKLQDLPPDVDAKVPINPHQTLRERMELLREERCWNCHHKINPLGETFEIFDDWGATGPMSILVRTEKSSLVEIRSSRHFLSREN